MPNTMLTPEILDLVAERFRVLGEPARLRILLALRLSDLTVTQLTEETELGQANVSRHLQILHSLGFVSRRKDGLYVYYHIADRRVFQLCDIMCGRLKEETLGRQKVLAG